VPEINRKLPGRNTAVQVLTIYTDSECHNVQQYRQTISWRQELIHAVRSAKNQHKTTDTDMTRDYTQQCIGLSG